MVLWNAKSITIFVVNVAVWTAISILMTVSNKDDRVHKMSMVFATESTKFFIALGYHLFFDSGDGIPAGVGPRFKRLLKFTGAVYLLVPAVIYMANNYLTYVALSVFDPGTYRVVINIKIIFTGIMMQLVFKKRLSLKKWGGLILLLIGCILGKIGGGTLPGITEVTLVAWGLLVLQAVCSSFGSVYFQWILQHGPKSAKGTGIWEKNIYLYLAGSVLNGLFTVVWLQRSPLDENFLAALTSNYAIGLTIFLTSVGGIAISLLLKHLDSIIKEFTSASELFTTAILQWPILGIAIRPMLVVAIFVVSIALKLYNSKDPEPTKGDDEEKAEYAPVATSGSHPEGKSEPYADKEEV